MSWMKRIGLVALVVAFAIGCFHPNLHSNVEEHWGESYEELSAVQIADPTAPSTREALQNLDPETGKRVAERYYEGQQQQRQRQAPTVIIGD